MQHDAQQLCERDAADERDRTLCKVGTGEGATLQVHVFLDPEKEEEGQLLGLAPWAKVLEVCGGRMRRTGDVPARYQVGELPSEGELRALGIGG